MMALQHTLRYRRITRRTAKANSSPTNNSSTRTAFPCQDWKARIVEQCESCCVYCRRRRRGIAPCNMARADDAPLYGNSDNETSNEEDGDGASALNVGATTGFLPAGTFAARVCGAAAALEKSAVCLGVLVAATACASASTASSTASCLQRHDYAQTDRNERQQRGAWLLLHAREHDSTFDHDVRGRIRHLFARLPLQLGAVIKQRHLQPVAVVDEPVVEEAATSGTEDSLHKRGAHNKIPDLV
jgi:hypothetical protein